MCIICVPECSTVCNRTVHVFVYPCVLVSTYLCVCVCVCVCVLCMCVYLCINTCTCVFGCVCSTLHNITVYVLTYVPFYDNELR